MPNNSTQEAVQVLADLKVKRDAERVRGHSLAQQRAEISYFAHTGDAKARAKLDKLNSESAMLDSEMRSLDCAIEEASARVEKAQAAEARAADPKKAAEMRKLVDELGQVPGYIDKHLKEAARGLLALEKGFARLRELGVAHPSDVQVRIAVVNAINTWGMTMPKNWHSELRDGMKFLAPHERRDFSAYWKAILCRRPAVACGARGDGCRRGGDAPCHGGIF